MGNASRIPRMERMSVAAMPPSGPYGYWPISSSSQLSRTISTTLNISARRRQPVVPGERGAGGHEQQRHNQIEGGADRVDLEGAEASALDLAHHMRQFGDTDRHGEAGVLEQRNGVVHQGGDGVAHRLR